MQRFGIMTVPNTPLLKFKIGDKLIWVDELVNVIDIEKNCIEPYVIESIDSPGAVYLVMEEELVRQVDPNDIMKDIL